MKRLIKSRWITIFTIMTSIAFPCLPPANANILGPAQIVDGDTLVIKGIRVRLYGIDAPESDQFCWRNNAYWHCGNAAALQLKNMISQQEVTCKKRGADRYKRIIGECVVNEQNIQKELVRLGLALAYRRYSLDYVPEEIFAQKNQRGLWSGQFIPPWEWRQGKRFNLKKEELLCPIKGNVNNKKEKIYHMPTGQHYHRTEIKPYEGDKCFKTESQAKSEGFRKSKR